MAAQASLIGSLRKFVGILRYDRKEIFYVYLYAILIGIFALVGPLGVQGVINLIAGGDFNVSLVVLVLVVSGAAVLVGVLKVMQYILAETLQRRVFSRAAFEFAYRLPRIRMAEFSNHYPPELVNRFFDTVTLQKGLPKLLMDFSGAVMQILFGLILVSLYHPFFAAFGGVLLLLLFLLLRVAAPSGLNTSLAESNYKYKVAGWLEDVARASNTFKLAGGERLTMRRADDLVLNYLNARQSHFRILLFHYGGLVVFQALVTAVFLLLGGKLVIDNQINIGQFVAAELVILSIVSSAEKLVFTIDVVYDTLTGVEKISVVTDLELERNGDLTFPAIDTNEGMSVSAHDLAFTYPRSGVQALRGIDFDFEAGDRVCIAGYNRSGRSTLIQLLTGLRTDFTGTLAFNKTPIANLNLQSLRCYIGDYSPEESIIPGNLIDNICLGHPDVEFADVQWAIRTAELEDWIQEQEAGFDTEMVAEGLNVPSSIRTRILLARAIVRRPRLVVLGGLLDQLEPLTRRKIIDTLSEKENKWTLVLTSNDPDVVRSCNRALLMRRGQILLDDDPESVLGNPLHAGIWQQPRNTRT